MNTNHDPAHLPRRQFIATTTTAITAFTVLPRHVLGGPKFVAPSAKVNVAIIGCGGQGRTNAHALFNIPEAQIVAVADPIERFNLERFYYKGDAGRKPVKAEIEKHYSAKTPNFRCGEYEDFRVMFEQEKAIDAILCATPDHLHALVSITAMRLGKHVYCEKPLVHNIWEARMVARVAKETGMATQMGNQGHSGEGIRATCEWIRDGAIGAVHEVHAWTRAGRWGKDSGRPQPAPVPPGVNWDLWVGTRETRPYSPNYTPVTWRDYWAFGTGPLGDMACHNLDPAVWALDLRAPISVEACAADGMDDEVAAPAAIFRYEFAPREDMPSVKVCWYDGGLRPERPEELEEDMPMGANGNGIIFIGEKGKIICPGWGGDPTLLPLTLMDRYQRPAKTIPRSKGHHRDWIEACKGGPPASSQFEYGARITEIVLLGNVALRVGKRIYWDAANMKARNAPEADSFVKEPYRRGWEIT